MREYIVTVSKVTKKEYFIRAASEDAAMDEAHEKFLFKHGDYDEMECREI